MAKHMLKYHVGVPLAIFAVLLAAGVPAGAAIFVGAMAGCMSMMVMMMGGRRSGDRGSHDAGDSGRRIASDEATRGSSR